ncbi:cupin domain-containing protein [Aliiglaciecola sp. 3_MG-2023]|uniref:cupin domain-containing protein n=1 Tax=Aliiglaciecola sp. 3_MG-2023 TaxID=3062644 RepID=UPI0026E41B61|nr:cupin domain-containing protein [Aliiglaciecola sp. 3_MG-2023]MDO6695445.1 cupin domain-containing protein [Aliiglaciecola sp. 3_MG-2023]
MQVTKLSDAKTYEAKQHWDMAGLRLQGADATEIEKFSCCLSYFLPGGGAEWASSPNEKAYIVLDGEITILTKEDGVQKETTLGHLDSCLIEFNELRAVENRTNKVATILVVISN